MNKNLETKKTKRQVFKEILESYELNDEHVEFITHEIDLLDNKSKNKKKKTDPVVEKIKTLILVGLEDKSLTITEMQKSIDGLSEFTNQKISAIVKKLVESGEVERAEVKGKAYFSVALSIE